MAKGYSLLGRALARQGVDTAFFIMGMSSSAARGVGAPKLRRASHESGISLRRKESDRPLSRFPLRGEAGGTAASAALRLGQSTGPRQNAHPRSGPVRNPTSGRGSSPDPVKLPLAEMAAPG